MSITTSILLILCFLYPYFLGVVAEEVVPSSSSNWDLSENERKIIRKEGYCMKLCGIGYDSETDGYDVVMRHYHKTKSEGTYDDLDTALGNEPGDELDAISDMAPLLEELKEEALELKEEALELNKHYSVSPIKNIYLTTEVYCKYTGISFEDCMELQRGLISQHQGDVCVSACLEEVSQHSIKTPEFNDMSPIKQKFEECLDEFRGPDEFFDFQDQSSTNIDDMLRVLRKNGFVVIQNFFSTELMAEVNEIMNSWAETEKWNNLTYSDFYSVDPDQLNAYENRLEIVLPFVYPFETVLSTVHESILMELMSAYGSHQPINIDFPASILSRPGALNQDIHSDHGYVAGMLKLNVAIHDIPEKSGPTSFCPCTHQNGIIHQIYSNTCRIRYHLKLVKAGTVIIYDQSMKHNGMANKGRLKRRYILDLSYNIGNVANDYTHSYPDLATEHIRKYREAFHNLNLVFK